MKSERLKGLPPTTSNYYNSFQVKTLPRETDCTDFPSTVDDSDIEEYYPFVIGRGASFKIIDPKVYKQLRKHNIPQTKHIRIAECAKKSSKTRTHESGRKSTSSKSAIEMEDEYCELSPLAKGPAPFIPPRRTKQPVVETRETVNRLTPSKKRVQNEYHDPKAWMVKLNSQNTDSSVTTKLCVDDIKSEKDLLKGTDGNFTELLNEKSRTYLCGHDTEEVVDYATCMCCVKGFFYHCTKDSEDEGRIADDPCSCSGPLRSCLPRWGCLAVLSIFLPCLLCYLPVAGCRKAASCISCKKKKAQKRKTKSTAKDKRTLTL
ncbi:uncharacterized protein LOC110251253 [Exaiptasia diaphana]|uniref:Uncharacterized protein n=1 Tax=Exaiptasia diaphana TaxID=2652724 RepID=A0A913Y2V3_EXADI|nr:uncharacterized protein LOC110251253 [Exaiptasia diaphana]KXJ23057.1 Protein sprouty-like 2 [Exaiptasia diaphana]